MRGWIVGIGIALAGCGGSSSGGADAPAVVCGDGTKLDGATCVPASGGAGGTSSALSCGTGTHLVGTTCVADGAAGAGGSPAGIGGGAGSPGGIGGGAGSPGGSGGMGGSSSGPGGTGGMTLAGPTMIDVGVKRVCGVTSDGFVGYLMAASTKVFVAPIDGSAKPTEVESHVATDCGVKGRVLWVQTMPSDTEDDTTIWTSAHGTIVETNCDVLPNDDSVSADGELIALGTEFSNQLVPTNGSTKPNMIYFSGDGAVRFADPWVVASTTGSPSGDYQIVSEKLDGTAKTTLLDVPATSGISFDVSASAQLIAIDTGTTVTVSHLDGSGVVTLLADVPTSSTVRIVGDGVGVLVDTPTGYAYASLSAPSTTVSLPVSAATNESNALAFSPDGAWALNGAFSIGSQWLLSLSGAGFYAGSDGGICAFSADYLHAGCSDGTIFSLADGSKTKATVPVAPQAAFAKNPGGTAGAHSILFPTIANEALSLYAATALDLSTGDVTTVAPSASGWAQSPDHQALVYIGGQGNLIAVPTP